MGEETYGRRRRRGGTTALGEGGREKVVGSGPDLGCGGDEAAAAEETGAVDEVGRGGRRRRR